MSGIQLLGLLQVDLGKSLCATHHAEASGIHLLRPLSPLLELLVFHTAIWLLSHHLLLLELLLLIESLGVVTAKRWEII